LIRRWIGPNFIFPEHNGILDDFQPNQSTFDSLMDIAKVLLEMISFNLRAYKPLLPKITIQQTMLGLSLIP